VQKDFSLKTYWILVDQGKSVTDDNDDEWTTIIP